MVKRILIQRPRILPKKAKRVFKGILFDIYQWKQKMFDGSIQVFERLKRDDTVVIVPITESKKILVLKQKQPDRKTFYSFPGGRVDDPKNFDLEALRELKEETGYAPTCLKLWKSHQVSSKIDSIVYFFIAQCCKKVSDPVPDPAGEKIAIQKLSFKEFLSFAQRDTFRKAFIVEDILHAYYNERYRKKLKKTFFT